MVSKKRKIEEKMVELQNEYKRLVDMQEQYENSIRTMTGGYSTEDLVTRVIETTNSVDKNGNPIKVTKYVLKYPDTIIPVAPEYECDNVIPGEIEEPIDDANMMNE
jgi:hypothetical protein